MESKFDVIIPVAAKDVSFLPKVLLYVRKYFKDADVIYVITDRKNFKYLKRHIESIEKCELVDENNLLPGLTFGKVSSLLSSIDSTLSVGWFFQQFLKYGFALTDYAGKYYLSWDADTLPLREISFFEDKHPLFAFKDEYNPNYFKTIEKLLGLKKNVRKSFIAEHMLFDKDIVRELINKIEKSAVQGQNWIEKIINAGDYLAEGPTFSEFESYGTYVSWNYPDYYRTRRLNTFRCGGYIQGRNISDEKLSEIAFDTDTISFELRHAPLFPYNIYCRVQFLYLIFIKLHKYSISQICSRVIGYLFRKR